MVRVKRLNRRFWFALVSDRLTGCELQAGGHDDIGDNNAEAAEFPHLATSGTALARSREFWCSDHPVSTLVTFTKSFRGLR
jgi:hypothetical protein